MSPRILSSKNFVKWALRRTYSRLLRKALRQRIDRHSKLRILAHILRDACSKLSAVEAHHFVTYTTVARPIHFRESVLPNLDEHGFQGETGFFRRTFHILVEQISTSSAFRNRQAGSSVEQQLGVVLSLLRSQTTFKRASDMFGIGAGSSVTRFRERVFESILELESEYLSWPDEEERANLESESLKPAPPRRLRLPHCIGYVDGTHSKLKSPPSIRTESFYSRHMCYAIRWQITCSHDKRILHVIAGHRGCAHDSRMFKDSLIHRDASDLFSGHQYLAADSSYACSTTCIPSYKVATVHANREQRKRFNKIHSRNRSVVEDCIGAVKGLFPSLRELHIKINSEEDVKLCAKWIRVCCVLYNFHLAHEEQYQKAHRRSWDKEESSTDDEATDDDDEEDYNEDDATLVDLNEDEDLSDEEDQSEDHVWPYSTAEGKRIWIRDLII